MVQPLQEDFTVIEHCSGERRTADAEAGTGHRSLSNWLWRPWYAKVWWAAIPAYWLAVSEPIRPAFLDWYVHGNFATYVAPFFTPMVALIILGAGYFRERAAEREIGRHRLRQNPFDATRPGSPFAIQHRHEEWGRRPHKNN